MPTEVTLTDRDLIDIAYSLRATAGLLRDEAARVSIADPELRRTRVLQLVSHANALTKLAERFNNQKGGK